MDDETKVYHFPASSATL